MPISRNGTRPTQTAETQQFTGRVHVEHLFQSAAPARTAAAYVSFEPCARSDWHTHPLGQTLEALDGKAVEWLEKVSDAQYAGDAS